MSIKQAQQIDHRCHWSQRLGRRVGPKVFRLGRGFAIGGGYALLERVTPAQAAEATEVPVRRDPLASGFDRHCRQVRVRHEVASCANFRAQAAKKIPVAQARLHANAVRRFAQLIGKGEGVRERARFVEHLGVRHDADEPAQHELGNSKSLVTIDHAGLATTADLRRNMPYAIIIVIASALVIAEVMLSTGAAKLLAAGLLVGAERWGPDVALAIVLVVTWVPTELMSNNAAAASAFPVALGVAQRLGLDPMPFVMAVIYAASCSFITPYGYQTNLMGCRQGAIRWGPCSCGAAHWRCVLGGGDVEWRCRWCFRFGLRRPRRPRCVTRAGSAAA